MRLINRAIDFLLYSSLFTACCAVALCMATERLVTNTFLPLTMPLHLALWGSTLMVYNAPRVYRNLRLSSREPAFRTMYLPFFLLGGLLVALTVPRLGPKLLPAGLLLGWITLSYSLPLLPLAPRKRLREYGILKPFVLAAIWTISTSVFPILYSGKNPLQFPFEVLLRFLLIFSLCLVFDIRDIRTDQRDHIATWPQRLGLHTSYQLIHLFLLLFAICSVVQFSRYHDGIRLLASWVTAAVAIGVVRYLRRHPSDRAYHGLGDGVMLIYAALVLLP